MLLESISTSCYRVAKANCWKSYWSLRIPFLALFAQNVVHMLKMFDVTMSEDHTRYVI